MSCAKIALGQEAVSGCWLLRGKQKMGSERRWPERIPRPKVRRLADAERTQILRTLEKGISASPLLSVFGIKVRVARGRFYIERQRQGEKSETCIEVLGRFTPLAGAKKELLREAERRRGNWFEVARGQAAKLIRVVASDTRGTFHGLGSLDASLRRLEEGQQRLPMIVDDSGKSVYADTDEGCSVQEALFHYLGLPIEVIAKPSGTRITAGRGLSRRARTARGCWCGSRQIACRERSSAVLACMLSGRATGGAHTIKPSESQTIAQAEAWLVKRKWRAW